MMMNEQELKYVADKWIDEYGDRAPSQIRQWAKDQDLEADAPRLFETALKASDEAGFGARRAARPVRACRHQSRSDPQVESVRY